MSCAAGEVRPGDPPVHRPASARCAADTTGTGAPACMTDVTGDLRRLPSTTRRVPWSSMGRSSEWVQRAGPPLRFGAAPRPPRGGARSALSYDDVRVVLRRRAGVSWKLNDRPTDWKLFVLAASYVFYGWADWRFGLLLAGSTVGNWVLRQALFRARNDVARKRWMFCAVGLNLVVLGFFKYYGFFVESVLTVPAAAGLAATADARQMALPVGVSFFTFRAISYVVDVFRRDQDTVGLLDFAVYLSFFPHLVAGPIVRVVRVRPADQSSPPARRP